MLYTFEFRLNFEFAFLACLSLSISFFSFAVVFEEFSLSTILKTMYGFMLLVTVCASVLLCTTNCNRFTVQMLHFFSFAFCFNVYLKTFILIDVTMNVAALHTNEIYLNASGK